LKTGEWIKAGRTRIGYSRERLAEALDCSVRAIKDWEANEREPSARFLVSLVPLIGMPSDLEYKRLKVGVRGIPGTDRTLALMEFNNSKPRREAEA